MTNRVGQVNLYSDSANWSGGKKAGGAGATLSFHAYNVVGLYHSMCVDEDATLGVINLPSTRGALSITNNASGHGFIFDNGASDSLIQVTDPRFYAPRHINIPITLDNTTLKIICVLGGDKSTSTMIFNSFAGNGNLYVNNCTGTPDAGYLQIMRISGLISITGNLTLDNSPTYARITGDALHIDGKNNTYPGGTFVKAGNMYVHQTGGLGTGNVFVGAYAILTLNASDAINPDATLSFTADPEGASMLRKVNLGPSGTVNTVRGLMFGNDRQPPRTYTAVSDPDYFTGAGTLIVLPPKGSMLFLK